MHGFPIQGATCLDGFIQTGAEFVKPKTDAERKAEHETRMQQYIGRRIRFLEPPEMTERWRQGRLRLQGKVPWLPTYGMTGTIIGMPKWLEIGGGPTVQWDDSHVSTLGSVSEYEFIS
jgi:hypothetical protein